MRNYLLTTFPKKSLSLEFILFLAIALVVLLRIIYLGSREFWYDEVLSLLLSNGQKLNYKTPGDIPTLLSAYTQVLQLPVENSLGDILNTLKNLFRGIASEPHPFFFYLSQHIWLRLFGDREAAFRGLEVFLSICTIISAYGLGRILLGNRGGLIFAALLGANPFFFYHSLNARMYCPLVFWVVLSGWALVYLLTQSEAEAAAEPYRNLLWNCLFIATIAGGLLTFYFFSYWLVALGVLALYIDRSHWKQHALRFTLGCLAVLPWVLWGTEQQVRNADTQRFATSMNVIKALPYHLADTLQTLGVHLVVGDWAAQLPGSFVLAAGGLATAFLVFISVQLWQRQERHLLIIGLILGVLPFSLALTSDILTQKFTIAWGLGRSVIYALPGCLLLITVWLEKVTGAWRRWAVITTLVVYLGFSIGDFSGRNRQMFHMVNRWVQQQADTPTLLVMGTKAWGHVLRLAYYVDPHASVDLLATKPVDLADSLQKSLTENAKRYSQVLWLEPADAVWAEPKTNQEKQAIHQTVQDTLNHHYQFVKQTTLKGTMALDEFTLSLYSSSKNLPQNSKS